MPSFALMFLILITVFGPMCLITETFKIGIPDCLHALTKEGITAEEPAFCETSTPAPTTVSILQNLMPDGLRLKDLLYSQIRCLALL